ncbi:MAG: DUF5317 domain-containing protein [Anaerolineales bacterium]|jgi:hypothetical protein
MPFMMIPVLIAILAALTQGGDLKNLARLRVERAWLPLTMVILQFAFVLFPRAQDTSMQALRPWITLSSYGLLIAFLFANRSIHGMKIVLIGAALNLLVISANGGHMPVTREALEHSGHLDKIILQAGREYVQGSKDVVLERQETHLLALSDVLKVPWGQELPVTFSPGDVFIMAGAAWLTFTGVRGLPLSGQKPHGYKGFLTYLRREKDNGVKCDPPDDRKGADRAQFPGEAAAQASTSRA